METLTVAVTPQKTPATSLPVVLLPAPHSPPQHHSYKLLLAINYAFLFVGSVSSSLLSKFYFVHKGSSRWVATFVQCAGFPLLLPPIIFLQYRKSGVRRRGEWFLSGTLFCESALVGLLVGINNLLFSWGNSYLPVSTSSLLLSSQLAFTLLISAVLVKQRVTFSNLNCVVLLTLTSLLLAFSSDGRRHNQNCGAHKENIRAGYDHYDVGVLYIILAGLLFALYLPVMERIYRRVDHYLTVLKVQLVIEFSATALALCGMAFSGGFSEMGHDMRRGFDLGSKAYALTMVGSVVTWQMCFLGTAGMVFLTGSITGGICMTALMGMNVVGGVVVFGDEFGGVKGVATVLCAWGFCSYVYGLYVKRRKEEEECRANITEEVSAMETEMVDRFDV